MRASDKRQHERNVAVEMKWSDVDDRVARTSHAVLCSFVKSESWYEAEVSELTLKARQKAT